MHNLLHNRLSTGQCLTGVPGTRQRLWLFSGPAHWWAKPGQGGRLQPTQPTLISLPVNWPVDKQRRRLRPPNHHALKRSVCLSASTLVTPTDFTPLTVCDSRFHVHRRALIVRLSREEPNCKAQDDHRRHQERENRSKPLRTALTTTC
jgi:hypothetical protein